MYLAHYGLTEPPFSITPDPRFVFLSERHRDALAHLLFGVGQGGGGGFVQLTGEVGTGKTTLCRVLLEQLPDDTRVALVLNPQLSPIELLETICEELGLELGDRRGSRKLLVDLLNRYLLKAYALGLRVVLIIDEAQNLSVEALEQVRLLTNLETPTQKLLQILLLGQPELRTMLARDDLRQLAQRITARYHLTPLDADETAEYLRHRFRVAGGQRFPFTAKAIKRVHRHAGGVPRLINVIAERTLLAGYAHDETSLNERWVDRAAMEALPARTRRPHARVTLAIAAAIVAVIATLPWWRPQIDPIAAVATAATPRRVAATIPASPSAASIPAIPRIDDEALLQRLRGANPLPLPAWRALLASWRLPASDADAEVAAACTAPLAAQVHCLRGLAGLDKLAAQGRPALLRLRTDEGDAWAMLLGADAANARLQLGSQVFDTDRAALERVWTGEYAALWRAPAAVSATLEANGRVPAALAAGARGPAVEWLRGRLPSHYLPASDGPAQLDDAMRAAIRRYQRARGLTADGVIGPETLMALSSDQAGPRLLRTLE